MLNNQTSERILIKQKTLFINFWEREAKNFRAT